MPNVKQAVAFFMVADMAAALSFYVDAIGFRVTKTWEPKGTVEWCWLDLDGVAIMLQQYREAYMPQDKRGVGVSVCFMCEDALALYRSFVARGLTPKKPFVGNAMWVVGLTDPDGYSLVFESVTDVAEETEYDPSVH